MKSYITVLRKFDVLAGRARRQEYWMFFLFNIMVVMALCALEEMLHSKGTITNVYSLLILVPSITVAVRRLHDTGHSGWWLLIPILSILLLLKEGDQGRNSYGEDPKL